MIIPGVLMKAILPIKKTCPLQRCVLEIWVINMKKAITQSDRWSAQTDQVQQIKSEIEAVQMTAWSSPTTSHELFFFWGGGGGGGTVGWTKQSRKETEWATILFTFKIAHNQSEHFFFISLMKVTPHVITTLWKAFSVMVDFWHFSFRNSATRHNIYLNCSLVFLLLSFKTIFDECIYACLDLAQLPSIAPAWFTWRNSICDYDGRTF